MKQRTLKILSGVIEGKEPDLDTDDKFFASLIRPKKLTGRMTDEIRYDHSFENNCIVLSRFINQPVKTLTTKEYFTLIGYHNAQTKR
jgi:hypothetical protein